VFEKIFLKKFAACIKNNRISRKCVENKMNKNEANPKKDKKKRKKTALLGFLLPQVPIKFPLVRMGFRCHAAAAKGKCINFSEKTARPSVSIYVYVCFNQQVTALVQAAQAPGAPVQQLLRG
jgi:hypothetical protein